MTLNRINKGRFVIKMLNGTFQDRNIFRATLIQGIVMNGFEKWNWIEIYIQNFQQSKYVFKIFKIPKINKKTD